MYEHLAAAVRRVNTHVARVRGDFNQARVESRMLRHALVRTQEPLDADGWREALLRIPATEPDPSVIVLGYAPDDQPIDIWQDVSRCTINMLMFMGGDAEVAIAAAPAVLKQSVKSWHLMAEQRWMMRLTSAFEVEPGVRVCAGFLVASRWFLAPSMRHLAELRAQNDLAAGAMVH